MTVASHSRAQKSLIEQFMVETGGATFFDEPPGPNLPLQYKVRRIDDGVFCSSPLPLLAPRSSLLLLGTGRGRPLVT